MKKAVYDIEGNGLLVPIYDSKEDKLIPPCDTIWCMVIKDQQTKEVFRYRPDEIVDGYKKLLEYDKVIGHNVTGYDGPVLEELVGKPNNLPPLKNVDTYIMSRLLYAPRKTPTPSGNHSIEAYGEKFKYPKLEFDDWSKFTEEMLEYCVVDVEIGERTYDFLYNEMGPELYQAYSCEHEFAEIISEQMFTGACLDLEAHTNLIQVLHVAAAEARDKLVDINPPGNTTYLKTPRYYFNPDDGKKFSLKGDAPTKLRKRLIKGPPKKKIKQFNPNSAPQLADYFINVKGYVPTKFTDSGAPSFGEEVLEKMPYDEAEIILDYRIADKRLSQCNSWLNFLYKGRVHGSVNTMGATTYRCTHNNPNMTAVPASRKPYGKECRGVWVAQEGWELTGTDAKGLELRMLANALYPYDNGQYIDLVLSGEAHNRNQEILELNDRDTAKTVIYAFNYSAGLLKLGRICRESEGLRVGSENLKLHPGYIQYLKDNNWYTEENVTYAKMGKLVKSRLFKNIHGLSDLIASLTDEYKKYGWILGIDGRRIHVDSMHSILNRRLQSDGGIVMKYSLIEHRRLLTNAGLLSRIDYNYILNVHDEFQTEHKPEHRKLIQVSGHQSIETAGKLLNIQCPLAGDSSSGRSWAETH